MKIQRLLILIIILIWFTNCKNDFIDNEENYVGITFLHYDSEKEKASPLVYYDEILGYDSTKYAYVLDKLAWERINNKIDELNPYVYPFTDIVLEITLDNTLIYRVGYLRDISESPVDFIGGILFKLVEPNLIYFQPENPEMFKVKGEDFRNDSRLIELLKKDNKLIEIEN